MICWILLTSLGSLVATEDWPRYRNSVMLHNNSTPCNRLAMAFKTAMMEEIKNKLTSHLVYNCDLEFAAAYAGENQRDFVDLCPDCAVLRFPFKASKYSGRPVEAIVHDAMNRWGSRWDNHADCYHPVGCAEYWDPPKVNGVFTCVFNKTGFHDKWGECSSISAATKSPYLGYRLL